MGEAGAAAGVEVHVDVVVADQELVGAGGVGPAVAADAGAVFVEDVLQETGLPEFGMAFEELGAVAFRGGDLLGPGALGRFHHADEVFTSWGRETPHKFERAKIEAILKSFAEGDEYGEILRAKGMVEDVAGGWIYFDMVPGEYELRDGEPDYTGRLCVIGTNIDEHHLDELFGL